MSLRAYILTKVTAGKLEEALSDIRNLPGILEVERTSGPADIIAIAEVADQPALGALLRNGFQSGRWIEKTVTCLTAASITGSETIREELMAEKMLVSVSSIVSENRLARTSSTMQTSPFVPHRPLDVLH